MKDTCESCMHFKPKKGPAYERVIDGECRAMPPQVRFTYVFVHNTKKAPKLGEVIEESAFPMVRNNTWCGLYEDPDDREQIIDKSSMGM